MDGLVNLGVAHDRQMIGGKAAVLGELLQAGFRVPAGFVVRPDLVLDTTTEQTILQQFDDLHMAHGAVRSSGMNEDSRTAAWAGQLSTYLNVDRSGLLDAIRHCRKSAHTDRATAYASLHNLGVGGVAVLVQVMVESSVSGVAFSVHPVSHESTQLVLEAGLGLGEAIVSGEITPDTFVIDKASGAVVERFISTQTKRLVRGDSKGNSWQTLDPPVGGPKLNENQLAELTQTVKKIEQFCGFPVDVEWGYADNELFILQSRPITTIS